MQTNESIQTLLLRIEEYKKKYYLNQLVKGGIFFLAFALTIYLVTNAAEYFGRFSTPVRATLFYGSLAILVSGLYHWVLTPLVHLYGLRRQLSDEEAARQIGQYFPEVGDRLLNTLQLRAFSRQQTDLLQASLNQRSRQLLIVRFADAVQIQQNRRFLKYAVYPALVILGLLLLYPTFLTSSSDRILRYNEEFVEEAPFQFQVQNKALQAFRNEDFTVNLQLKGNALPEDVYLVSNNTRFKLEQTGQGQYAYTFDNVQRDIPFRFEAAGYKSNSFELSVLDRPSLLSFDVSLVYPAYLNKPAEQLANVGNMLVPEGTVVTWRFSAANTDSVRLKFSDEIAARSAQKQGSDAFELSRQMKRSSQYAISLKNAVAANRDNIQYSLNVIPDKFPQVSLENYRDTTFFNYIMLGGTITDDYGFSNLRVNYKVIRAGQSAPANFLTRAIPYNRTAATQNFYYQWNLDTLRLQTGDRLEYFVQVWDNDAVNGYKSARSTFAQFAVPDKAAIEQEAQRSAKQTEQQLDKTLAKTQQLKRDLNSLENRLQTKKNLDYQDKKQAEDLLKKREEIMQELKHLQEQNKISNERSQRFRDQSPELMQKFEQLQKMMNDLMDPETQKLYDELKKMLDQKQDDRMLDQLEKLKNKERNFEKELERALELFKQLQMEQKMENVVKDLEQLAEKQEKLADQTQKGDKKEEPNAKSEEKNGKKGDDKNAKKDEKAGKENDPNNKNKDQNGKENQDGKDDNKEGKDTNNDNKDNIDSNQELEKQQEQLNKEFEQTKESLDAIEKMAEEMKNADKPDTREDLQQQISEQQQQSQQQLNQKQNNKAAKSQKEAAKQMRNLSQQLQQQMQSEEAQETQENMDDLRDILENLLTLSHNQERVMKDFRGVSLQDPRFTKLAQEQLKLQEDAKIIEDSLYALANRVLQIQTFVTRELNSMKSYMDESAKYIRERRLNVATGKQQFAMTSMNNLALMLSDVFKQMQEQMNNMSMPGSGKGKKKGQKSSSALGQMQKQLNERMKQMQQQMQNGKGGRGMSEELSRLAAEQAMIRKMLKEIQDAQKGTEIGKKLNGELKELMEKMDETETDLVNKRVNQNVQKRQDEILTRLLESEKAIKEQEEDLQRKAETAKPVFRKPPAQFEQLVKERQKQAELLRSIPPDLVPFYKREVDSYLNKLK